LYGDNNDAFSVILVKPDKGVDMDAFKAELAQKLEIIMGLKIGRN
jgi:putative ABC transport system permease protein